MTQNEERAAELDQLLAANYLRHPRYGGDLASHLPMALRSLYALGASAERLRDFARHYAGRLDPMPARGALDVGADWPNFLGRDDVLADLVFHFERDLKLRGRHAVLREALAQLAPSLASAAFHCLIRTAFGARFEDDAEIARGLAYWVVTNETLGALESRAPRERDPNALLERIRSDPELGHSAIEGNLISTRMLRAASLPGFAAIASDLVIDEGTLDRLAQVALELYASTGNFTALHGLTSTHALRILRPFARDPTALLRHHWQGLAAAFITIGSPRPKPFAMERASAWNAILDRAIESNDDHDAKLVFACREEGVFRKDDRYRFAAALRMKLLG